MEEDGRSNYQKEFDDKVEPFARELIREKLIQLPKGHQEFFDRLYPGGIEELKLSNMRQAYCQCVASIRQEAVKK